MVQNANLKASQFRSARTGLALALLAFWSQTSLLVVADQASPCAVLAQAAGSAQAISSAGPPSSGDYPSTTTPVTRIRRPHAPKASPDPSGKSAPTAPSINNDGGSEIKLMPLKPVTDPIGSPISPVDKPKGQSTGQPTGQSTGNGGAAPAGPPKPVPLGPGGEDPYPTIGKLEGITLGSAQPTMPITDRLARLENTVFKRVYGDDSLFDRTDRLKRTLLGAEVLDPNSAAARDREDFFPQGRGSGLGIAPGSRFDPSLGPNLGPGMGLLDNSLTGEQPSAVNYLDEIASKPENREVVTAAVLDNFALEIINIERRNGGLAPLAPDTVAELVASTHVQELAQRSVLSHFSVKGDNPDRRYTLAGGNDAMVESIASIKCSELGNKKLTKAALAKTLKALLTRQDDRDALMSPDASHLGFSMALSADGDKLLSAFEVVTRHGLIEALPKEVAVGEKLDVKGAVEAPYIFDRVTVAWEAYNGGGSSSAADESEDALPYFPPLDYVAYAGHSDRDYSKAIFALKAAGVVAAIAGGMFIPPIALAAPLIMMSGGPGSEPKPVSDIPVKGGVKVEGASFDAKIPMSNGNKEGLYYITVYGSLGSHAQQSVAISRRVLWAKLTPKEENGHATKPATKYDEEVSGQAEIKGATGTTGGEDLKAAPGVNSNPGPNLDSNAGSNSAPNPGPTLNPNFDAARTQGKSDVPEIYTPESKDSKSEGKADVPTKP